MTECVSHVVFETRDLQRSINFYSKSLGAGVPMNRGNETMIPVRNGQMIGLVEVPELSERSKKHGRGCHMAMDVPQEDFDSMVILVERHGGKAQGGNRAADELRPEGERRIYFFDPDNNRLQITAHAPNQKEELLPDEEKWRRIIAGHKEQGPRLKSLGDGWKKIV